MFVEFMTKKEDKGLIKIRRNRLNGQNVLRFGLFSVSLQANTPQNI